MSGELHSRRADSALILEIANPAKGNALSGAILAELDAALARAENDAGVGALIITGQGRRAFCAGADIGEWAQLSPACFARDWVRAGHRVFDRLAAFWRPTIAAINGAAFGGGLELAAACDLRIASPKAVLRAPETTLGVVPGWSGSRRLSREMPPALVREMLFTGAALPARRAFDCGFINRLADEPLAAALALAAEINACAPTAIAIAKRMSAGGDADIEALGGWLAAAGSEVKEGVAAFKEKRKPDFRQAARPPKDE